MSTDALIGAASAFLIAVLTTPVGVSGAVFLVPVQVKGRDALVRWSPYGTRATRQGEHMDPGSGRECRKDTIRHRVVVWGQFPKSVSPGENFTWCYIDEVYL